MQCFILCNKRSSAFACSFMITPKGKRKFKFYEPRAE